MKIEPPQRKRHSYSQLIQGNRGRVFPLLCPVAEALWVPGWAPEKVLSNSGVAETGCVFITPSDNENSIWVISKHDPESFELEMYKITPHHTVGKLEIALEKKGHSETIVHVSYEFTAIGKAGQEFLEAFTEDWYTDFMQGWEKAMNHYLETGVKIA